MGRYSRRDEGLRVLLSSQEGWGKLRDMELPDAAALFRAGTGEADRAGAARALLGLAALHGALAELDGATQVRYVDALGPAARPDDWARGCLAKLLLGDPAGSKHLLERAQRAAAGRSALLTLAEGVIEASQGHRSEAVALARAAFAASDRGNRDVLHVACLLWDLPCAASPSGRLSEAETSRRKGNPEGALRALARADGGAGNESEALFSHWLGRRVYGALAWAALAPPPDAPTAFWGARAKEHQGDDAGAAELYAKAAGLRQPEADPSWLFSAVTGSREGARLARVFRGTALQRAGQGGQGAALWKQAAEDPAAGPLVAASLALAQVRLGQQAPYREPVVVATDALAQTKRSINALPTSGASELLSSVFPVRSVEVARLAAEVYRRKGNARAALDTLEGVHRKAGGYRPDFVNPPDFFVEYARTCVETGEYATAVAVLFELSRQYGAAVPTYEGVKRLYATQAGGGTPPKY